MALMVVSGRSGSGVCRPAGRRYGFLLRVTFRSVITRSETGLLSRSPRRRQRDVRNMGLKYSNGR